MTSKSNKNERPRRPSLVFDADRMPVWLYLPNLIGYLRWLFLFVFVYYMHVSTTTTAEESTRERRSTTIEYAMWSLLISLGLDFIDGPVARRYRMCSQFGDLNDHVCDHITMFLGIAYTSIFRGPGAWFGTINILINAIHASVALFYMFLYGHYFKHSKMKGNFVTRNIETNNYWNIFSVLWAANYMIVPLVKMSYAASHGLEINAATPFLTFFDGLGMCVCAAYTIAVWV